MAENTKKLLKKTIKFVILICSILAGIVLLKGVDVSELKEKFKKL